MCHYIRWLACVVSWAHVLNITHVTLLHAYETSVIYEFCLPLYFCFIIPMIKSSTFYKQES